MRDELQIKTEDYIWQRGFNTRDILSIPSLEEIGPNGILGNKYPSDHFSLVASIGFIKE